MHVNARVKASTLFLKPVFAEVRRRIANFIVDYMNSTKDHHAKPNPRRIGRCIVCVALLTWEALCLAEPRSLDEAQFELLAQDCQKLIGRDGMAFFDNVGPNLYNICGPRPGGPPGGGGTGGGSVGSGAGSVQAQFVTPGWRLAKRRGQNEAESGAAGDTAEIALANGVNVFFAGQFEAIDRQNSRFESGYSGNAQGAAFGADWRANDWLLAGTAFNYSYTDSHFANQAGGFQVDSFGPAIYATLTPNENTFVDLVLEYAHQARARDRLSSFPSLGANKPPVSALLSSDFGADRYGANALAGYDFTFGSFVIGPRLGFHYSDMSIDAYSETGNSGLELTFLGDRIRSLQSSIGLMASAALSSSVGVFSPQINFDWTHEFQNRQRDIRASFVEDGRDNPTVFSFNNDRPDRDFFHLGAGVGLTLPNGIQPYVNFDALLGNHWFGHLAGTVGVRLSL